MEHLLGLLYPENIFDSMSSFFPLKNDIFFKEWNTDNNPLDAISPLTEKVATTGKLQLEKNKKFWKKNKNIAEYI